MYMLCFLFTISVVQKKLYIKLWSDFEIRTHYASTWGDGDVTLYKLYRYVPPRRQGFLRRFGLKTSIHFAHFGGNRVWFSRELRECMNVFIVSIPNE